MYEKSFRGIVAEVDFQVLGYLAVQIVGLIRREVGHLRTSHLAVVFHFLGDGLSLLIDC